MFWIILDLVKLLNDVLTFASITCRKNEMSVFKVINIIVDVCVYVCVQFCIVPMGPILCICISVIINTMLKLMLMLTLRQTRTLHVNKALDLCRYPPYPECDLVTLVLILYFEETSQPWPNYLWCRVRILPYRSSTAFINTHAYYRGVWLRPAHVTLYKKHYY